MSSLPASTITIPHGLPPWLVAFVEQAQHENLTLAENGAAQAFVARETLLRRLLVAVRAHLDDEITVEEAAGLLGKHPETIRRAIRKGALPDDRSKRQGRMRIRRGDLEQLAGPQGREYDPVADAHDIAQRRRK
jgi:excisionase family DNA binding protein